MSEKANENGLYDNNGLIDSLITDCNETVKQVVSGNYVLFCAKVVEMVQKLSKLKEGISENTQYLKKEIADLKKLNEDLSDLVNSTEKGE
jgi:hypothetical protein